MRNGRETKKIKGGTRADSDLSKPRGIFEPFFTK